MRKIIYSKRKPERDKYYEILGSTDILELADVEIPKGINPSTKMVIVNGIPFSEDAIELLDLKNVFEAIELSGRYISTAREINEIEIEKISDLQKELSAAYLGTPMPSDRPTLTQEVLDGTDYPKSHAGKKIRKRNVTKLMVDTFVLRARCGRENTEFYLQNLSIW
jgi:hypothetical protein